MVHRFVWTLTASIVLLIALSAPVIAATTGQSKNGITISPAFQDISILSGQSSTAGSFLIINNEATAVTYNLSSVDMGALDDTGGIVFSGLSADYHEKYGLSEWLELEKPQITIAAQSSMDLKFKIVDDGSLTPGGHYGAIIIKNIIDVKPEKNQIGFDPQAAALLFVRKIGGEKVKLSLNSKPPGSAKWVFPNQLALTFQNDGNVHLVPRGVVDVRGPSGDLIAHGIINSESSLILPEKTRNYIVQLTSQDHFLWPGRYTTKIAYRYDGEASFMVLEYSFMFYNLRLIISALAALSLAIYAAIRINRRYGHWLRPKIIKLASQALLYLGRQKSYYDPDHH